MTLGENDDLDKLLHRKRGANQSEGAPELGASHALESLADLYAAFSGSDTLHEEKPRAPWTEHDTEEIAEEETPSAGAEPEVDLEKALEIEEQDVIDDPVRMYLREIGNVSLLNAQDERVLASKMEEDRHIKKIREDWFAIFGAHPSATDIMVAMLDQLCRSGALIDMLAEELVLPPADSLAERITQPALRDAIDSAIDQGLLARLATRREESIAATGQALVSLSLNSGLLTQSVLDIIAGKSISEVKDSLTSPSFIMAIQSKEREFQAHIDSIAREAAKARRR